MRYATTAFLALLLVMALAAPAFAADIEVTGGDFGEHHSLHAQAGTFDGDHNPGVHHEGHDHDSHGH